MWRAAVVCVVFIVSFAHARIDCTQWYWADGSTKSGQVYCGNGYKECGEIGAGCCNEISASPIQLTLVILGPATLVSCLVFMVLVIRAVWAVNSEDRVKEQLPMKKIVQ